MRCPVCDKDIKGHSSKFKRHYEQQHSNTKPLDCPYCDKTCKKAGPLRKHVQNKHEEEEWSDDSSSVQDEEEEEEVRLPPNPFIDSEAIEDGGDDSDEQGPSEKKRKSNRVRNVFCFNVLCFIILSIFSQKTMQLTVHDGFMNQ
jgi:hypothetical protein